MVAMACCMVFHHPHADGGYQVEDGLARGGSGLLTRLYDPLWPGRVTEDSGTNGKSYKEASSSDGGTINVG